MGTIRTNAIVDAAGTGSPSFPNGVRVATIVGAGGANDAQINGITPALASQVEAQAGTDNAKLMTPLRVNEAIAALVTTTTVLNATAAATAGAVGTYIFAQTTGADALRNTTVAGSTLQSCSALSRNLAETNTAGVTFSNSEASLAGTWRCMGTYDYEFTRTTGPTGGGATLWLRIS